MTLENQTLAEVASGSHAAAGVLERNGLDYCAQGERLLGEVCSEKHIDTQELISQIDAALQPGQDRDWSSAPLRELMNFLVRVDHTCIRAELPVLQRRLQLVVDEYGAAYPTLLRLPAVFQNLMNDLETHMQGEERELFPAIEHYLSAMEAGERLKGSPLAAFGGPLHLMEREHESAGAALRLLREFCQNYNVPAGANLRYRALIDGLVELEDKLARHIYLENTILYPRAAALKASRRWQEVGAAGM